MQFSNIIGQDKIKNQLLRSANSGRIHHTQLLLGKEGAGGLPLAIAYAQYLNCEQPSAEDSCGQCSSCRQMSKLIHPNVYFSFPTIKPKGASTPPISTEFIKPFREFVLTNPYGKERDWLSMMETGNKQGNITARECAEIIKSVKLKVAGNRYKIAIIWMPERLGKDGNRLLKLLEEPPEQCLFILVAEDEDQILNTILSRSQILRLEPIKDQEVVHYLQSQFEVEPQKAQHIALLSQGNLGLAQQLLDDTSNEEHNNVYLWFQSILKTKGDLVSLIDQFAKLSREQIKNLLEHTHQVCREALFINDQVFPSRLSQPEAKIAQWLGNRLTLDQIQELSSIIDQTRFGIGRNGNVKILLLAASIKIDDLINQREG